MPSLQLPRLNRIFHPPQSIPPEYRSRFIHLFMDMAWAGVLSGTTLNFLSIYAARLGATTTQIGLISAAPAIVNLLFAIPAANWTRGRSLGASAFWSSVAARLFYLAFSFTPLLFPQGMEVWGIIAITLVMNLPLTLLNVSFNAMFIEAVPGEWRAFVVGGRNALFSIITVVFFLISGQILDKLPFPLGYQVVFGLGFFGAAMSSFHIFFLRKYGEGAPVEPGVKPPWFPRIQRTPETMKYLRVLLLLLAFHTTQYLVIPLVPIYSVDSLGLSDYQISLGGSLFNLIVFAGSFLLPGMTRRFGNHRLTGVYALGMGLFPFILALSRNFPVYMIAQVYGGVVMSIITGSLYNYLAENVPAGNRAMSMSWYIFVLNGGILAGSLLGPFISDSLGIIPALVIFGVLRLLTGSAILRWGVSIPPPGLSHTCGRGQRREGCVKIFL